MSDLLLFPQYPREEADAINACIVMAHSSNFETAAAVLNIKDRVLRDLRHAHQIIWMPPCRQQHWLRPVPAVVTDYWQYGRHLLKFMQHPLPPPLVQSLELSPSPRA